MDDIQTIPARSGRPSGTRHEDQKGGQGQRKLLRPEEIAFIVKEDGKWEYLTDKQIKEFTAQKDQGLEVPDVQRMTLFYPFTVFNAAQIEGFPPKESQTHAMTAVERNDFVERFIACAGIPVEHHTGDAYYEPQADMVKMPFPGTLHQYGRILRL